MKLTTHLCLVPRPKNGRSYTSTPPIHLHGVVISYEESRDNFTFTLHEINVLIRKKSDIRKYYIRYNNFFVGSDYLDRAVCKITISDGKTDGICYT
jgi:hypothetical protein